MRFLTRYISLPAPQFGHILQGLSLGLRNKAPYEEGCYHTDDAIESVGEPVTEIITLRQMHVEHRHEGRADDEVEDPLESYRYSNGGTTDGIGEYLGDKYPADRTP